jgi:hypothetical protein
MTDVWVWNKTKQSVAIKKKGLAVFQTLLTITLFGATTIRITSLGVSTLGRMRHSARYNFTVWLRHYNECCYAVCVMLVASCWLCYAGCVMLVVLCWMMLCWMMLCWLCYGSVVMLSNTEGCLGKCCYAECIMLSVLCSMYYAMLCCYVIMLSVFWLSAVWRVYYAECDYFESCYAE